MKLMKITNSDERYFFMCPGCKETHRVYIGPGGWVFNGDYNNPTLTPSVLVTAEPTPYRCHSFVTNGKIQFLSDCSHELAEQMVELPEIE